MEPERESIDADNLSIQVPRKVQLDEKQQQQQIAYRLE